MGSHMREASDEVENENMKRKVRRMKRGWLGREGGWVNWAGEKTIRVWRVAPTYIRPRNQVVRALVQRLDDRVIHHFLWQLKTKRVLDKVEDGLAAGGVPAHVDIGLEIRDDLTATVVRLLLDGLEEHVH